MSNDKKVSEMSIEELQQYIEQKKQEQEALEVSLEEAQERKRLSLEEAFISAQKQARDALTSKVKNIESLIREAEMVSEKYGVPFEILDQRYTPKSFFNKFEELLEENADFLDENADFMPDQYSGWHSSSSRC